MDLNRKTKRNDYLSLANFLISEGWLAILSDISSMTSPHSETERKINIKLYCHY